MEIIIGSEKIAINDELIEALKETINTIIKLLAEAIDNLSDVFEQLQEQVHHHCYSEDNVKRYYDRNKGCLCKKVTYKCNCGKRFYETYECYEPPPKQSDKTKVLKRNKMKYRR